MTEKRFVGRYVGRNIKKLIGIEDIETNRVCVTIEENIRLLNELAEENQHLEYDFQKYKDILKKLDEKMYNLSPNRRIQSLL